MDVETGGLIDRWHALRQTDGCTDRRTEKYKEQQTDGDIDEGDRQINRQIIGQTD